MATPSPISRTLVYLNQLGYLVEKVRRWSGCRRRRHSLFGLVDVLAVREGVLLGVRVLGPSVRLGAELRRLAERPAPALAAPLLASAGVRLELWQWRKRGGRWHATRTPLDLSGSQTAAVTSSPLPPALRWR